MMVMMMLWRFDGSEIKADVFTGAFDRKAAKQIDFLLSFPSGIDADKSRIDEEHRAGVNQHQNGGLKTKGA